MTFDATTSAVPEPGTVALLGGGLLILSLRHLRR
ncbi:MAG: PEP-CTERM sorting domain-containing protein [Bryobacteraceae bacterium]|nr:PEP-CTERM sorting domain-containing protein [Bryobacteraceae bacterium]